MRAGCLRGGLDLCRHLPGGGCAATDSIRRSRAAGTRPRPALCWLQEGRHVGPHRVCQQTSADRRAEAGQLIPAGTAAFSHQIEAHTGSSLQDSGLQGSGLQESSLQDSSVQDQGLQDSGLQGSGLQESSLQDSSVQDSFLQDSGLQGSGLQESGLQDTVCKTKAWQIAPCRTAACSA